MGFDLSLHHVRTMTAELLVDPVCLTLRFEQSVPAFRGDPMPDSVELSVFVTKDQDAADAYLLAAAINSGSIGVDDLEDRRRRAAMALGWVYVDDAGDGPGVPVVPGHWSRPIRDEDGYMLRHEDTELRAVDVEQALRHDLGEFF